MSKPKPTKKKPGRPKKISFIPTSEFKGIISQRPIGCNIEFIYTFPFIFKKFMNTFNSCGVKELIFEFLPDKIRIQGRVNKQNTSVDVVDDVGEDGLRLIIMPAAVYSYYCDQKYYLKFKLAEWDIPLGDIDESCHKMTLKFNNKTNILGFEAHNTTLNCIFKHQINLEPVQRGDVDDLDKNINKIVTGNEVRLENISCGDFKKVLTLKTRKGCNNVRFEMRGNEASIVFTQGSEMVMPIISEKEYKEIEENGAPAGTSANAIYVVYVQKKMCDYGFPIQEIGKFIMHSKEMKARLLFTEKAMLIRIINTDSGFLYYKTLDN